MKISWTDFPVKTAMKSCLILLSIFLLSHTCVGAEHNDLDDAYLRNLGNARNTRSVIKTINSSYYNLMEEKVNSIKFNFRLSGEDDSLRLLREKGRFDISKKIENMDIYVTCFPSRSSIEISVENKPFFDDEELDGNINGMVQTTKEIAREFLAIWKRYVTELIDSRYNHVKSIDEDGDSMTIELIDRGNSEYRLTFDVDHKLKYWEAFLPFESDPSYKEVPNFELRDSKYLVNAVMARDLGNFEISYQTVDGINIPEKVVFSSDTDELFDTVMFFTDVEVTIEGS